jgi:hypothetical protein
MALTVRMPVHRDFPGAPGWYDFVTNCKTIQHGRQGRHESA